MGVKDDSHGDMSWLDISYIGSDGKKKTHFINHIIGFSEKTDLLGCLIVFYKGGRVVAVY